MKPPFDSARIIKKYGDGDEYLSPAGESVACPTLRFMLATLFGPLLWLWRKAVNNSCDDLVWSNSSVWLAEIFERAGGRLVIEGLENLKDRKDPVVFVANHMSTLETFILPGVVRPYMPVTFVVKKSLTTMPIFGPVMRSRNPVIVERVNPRDDLSIVLRDGLARLQAGISIIVFPQHTRSLDFDRQLFNSIGIKLARKANVDVIPLALKTDAWGQGKRIKELGRIRPDLPAHFKFASPLHISGNGKKEHSEICDFIETTVRHWQNTEGVNR